MYTKPPNFYELKQWSVISVGFFLTQLSGYSVPAGSAWHYTWVHLTWLQDGVKMYRRALLIYLGPQFSFTWPLFFHMTIWLYWQYGGITVDKPHILQSNAPKVKMKAFNLLTVTSSTFCWPKQANNSAYI